MKISLWLRIVFFVVVFFSTFVFYSRAVFGASIAIDSGYIGNVFNGVNSFSSGSFNFSTMNPSMLPATYDSVNQYLYNSFGYDVDDALDYGSDQLTGFATGQVSNPLNGADALPSATANFVANTMQAGLTAQMLLENGYQYFAQRVPQWGANAKQFFLGKVNDVTGKITDVCDGFVTKITTQGLSAYSQIYNDLVDDGDINKISNTSPIKTMSFKTTGVKSPNLGSLSVLSSNLYFTSPVVIFTEPFRDYSVYPLQIIVPTSAGTFLNSSVFELNNVYGSFLSGLNKPIDEATFDIDTAKLVFSSTFTINGVEYVCGRLRVNEHYDIGSIYQFGDIDSAKAILEGEYSLSNSYDYSSSSSLSVDLKSQLDRLIGEYVDSLTLQRINDIIASIPIGEDVVDGHSVPVAIPTDDIIAELTAVIDDAIEDSLIYDTVFDAYYEEAVDTPTTPDPPSDDPDVYVPIDVPTTPINAIGSALTVPYMFSSIFEPIFIAFGGGLFSLWLFVPTLIIFVAILWAIK